MNERATKKAEERGRRKKEEEPNGVKITKR